MGMMKNRIRIWEKIRITKSIDTAVCNRIGLEPLDDEMEENRLILYIAFISPMAALSYESNAIVVRQSRRNYGKPYRAITHR
ncbi:hypothetical protein CDAR_175751 [Caerostris darwini]|uniref:Uncharacterized protein n=1 Tax=Caerostris darwini TaxID=1538125 RepID=A0AAV4U380_9ARAC|nr:hypothetical protein CDAR_175751 [Caerostris darwini]